MCFELSFTRAACNAVSITCILFKGGFTLQLAWVWDKQLHYLTTWVLCLKLINVNPQYHKKYINKFIINNLYKLNNELC